MNQREKVVFELTPAQVAKLSPLIRKIDGGTEVAIIAQIVWAGGLRAVVRASLFNRDEMLKMQEITGVPQDSNWNSATIEDVLKE